MTPVTRRDLVMLEERLTHSVQSVSATVSDMLKALEDRMSSSARTAGTLPRAQAHKTPGTSSAGPHDINIPGTDADDEGDGQDDANFLPSHSKKTQRRSAAYNILRVSAANSKRQPR